jgi:hypothetical protein
LVGVAGPGRVIGPGCTVTPGRTGMVRPFGEPVPSLIESSLTAAILLSILKQNLPWLHRRYPDLPGSYRP